MYKKIYIIIIFLFITVFNNKCFADANIVVNPSNSIPVTQTEYVINAVKLTMDYMSKNFDRTINKDLTINIVDGDSSASLFSSKEINNHIGGKTENNIINLIINSSSSEYYITFLTAHELIHQYQMDCYGSMQTLNKNLWFIEGMADVLGVKIASIINPNMESKFRKSAINAKYESDLSLSSITTKQSWKEAFYNQQKTYAKADLALLYLTDNYSQTLLFVYLNNLYNYSASTALKSTYNIDINELDTLISEDNNKVIDLFN